MTDELRERVARVDPLPATVPTDPVTSDRARALLEAVMSTPVLPDQVEATRTKRSRWPIVAGGIAAALALAIGVGAVLASRDDGPSAPPVALSLPATDPALSICIPFDPASLATAQLAFSGTVATIGDGTVTLDVDRWYRGGPADQAVITVPEGFMAALDGVDFVAGQRYLVTAADGQVLGCGSSGPATPELEQAFASAFG